MAAVARVSLPSSIPVIRPIPVWLAWFSLLIIRLVPVWLAWLPLPLLALVALSEGFIGRGWCFLSSLAPPFAAARWVWGRWGCGALAAGGTAGAGVAVVARRGRVWARAWSVAAFHALTSADAALSAVPVLLSSTSSAPASAAAALPAVFSLLSAAASSSSLVLAASVLPLGFFSFLVLLGGSGSPPT